MLRPVPPVPRPTIWAVEDLIRVVLTTAFGFAAVAVAWFIASGEGTFSSQFVAADVAVAGAVVVGVGNTMWILRGRRAVGARLRTALADLEADLGPEALATRPAPSPDPAAAATARPTLVLVGADGMRYFHRDTCRMARGREWPPTSLAQHLSSGRAPCPICAP